MSFRAVLAFALAIAGCAKGDRDSTADGRTITPTDVAIDSNGCSVQPCSILPECGCIGNTTCDIDVSDYDGTACRTINVEGTETATCTNAMECDRGYACLGVADSSCKKYCSADTDCGSPRGQCIYTVTDTNDQPIADIPKVCSSNCDPTDTSAALCPSVYKCSLFVLDTGGGSTADIADCSPAGAGTQGASCDQAGSRVDSMCAKGYQCVQFGANPFTCARICNTGAPACPSNTACVGFSMPIVVGGVTYGVCG